MNKVDLIIKFLDNNSLPVLEGGREYSIQEYMKLKHSTIYKLAEELQKNNKNSEMWYNS